VKGIIRVAIGSLAVVAVFYVIVCALLYVNQRSLLYYPVAAGARPSPDGPPIQIVSIGTADGERLVGWWLPPQDGQPTILFFNGNAAGLAIQEGRWRRIADRGVGFLAVAYRGYDGSTGKPTETGLRADARAAYDWLARRVDQDDIVIHGFSLGSGVAAGLATERPARALILEAPYTSTADVAAESFPWAPIRLMMLDQYRTRDIIDRVHIPILIIHGDADEVIPFHHGLRLYGMIDGPKTLVRMVGSNHNTLTRDGAYDHIWRFLGLSEEPSRAGEGPKARAVTVTSPP